MPSVVRVLLEACLVGILLIPITYLTGYVAKMIVSKPMLPDVCAHWNDAHIMEVNLFLAGFFFHIICQITGLNAYYVRNYQ